MTSARLGVARTWRALLVLTISSICVAACGQAEPPPPAQPTPQYVTLQGVEFSYGETLALLSQLEEDDEDDGGGDSADSGGADAPGGDGPDNNRERSRSRGRTGFYTSTGGVALSAVAQNDSGASIERLHYNSSSPDGQRLVLTMSLPSGGTRTVQVDAWDWEIAPLARFAATNQDGAFTYFGEYADGRPVTEGGFHPLGYHPALKDTLIGLRLMQLDLMAFIPQFSGYFRGAEAGEIVLGGGEREALGVDPNDGGAVAALTQQNYERFRATNQWFAAWCVSYPSQRCQSGQPHHSYVVGDLLAPVRLGDAGDLSGPVCWDFWRATEGLESPSSGFEVFQDGSGIFRLEDMSHAFCNYVRSDLAGMHPLIYRAAERAVHLTALFRRYKQQDRAGFDSFVRSLNDVVVAPAVYTPTEMRVLSM